MNMDFNQYCELLGLNYSRLKEGLKSPAHLYTALFDPEEREATLDMELGTLVHSFILEGKVPPHVLKPKGMSFATKDSKAWRQEQWDKNLVILSETADLRQLRMIKSLQKSDEAQIILANRLHTEHTIECDYRGVRIKARLDIVAQDHEGRPVIGDLKKTPDCSPGRWGKVAYDRAYLLQAVLYRTVYSMANNLDEAPQFVWIVVEDSAASPVQCFFMDADADRIGQRQLDQCIDTYKRCTETGEWPAYFQGIQALELPAYVK